MAINTQNYGSVVFFYLANSLNVRRIIVCVRIQEKEFWMFIRSMIACFFLLGLNACITPGYTHIGKDIDGKTYSMTRMSFTADGYTEGRCEIEVFSRSYERNGKTAVCGYLQSPIERACEGLGYGVDEMTFAWFNAATFGLNGQAISSASFFEYKNQKSEVPCIQTQTPWKQEFESAKPRVKGGMVSVAL